MTIDLGFAWLKLPNGVEVSIVDVPGHERFIHNMLAGVGGIDIALLVVAADEGIMPQTREHLAILDLLGVRNGVVALTKRDLVEPDWLELVQVDVEEHLANTSLRGAPVVSVSATTGAGQNDLLAVIQDLLSRDRTRAASNRPRLPVDRVFTVSGFGTVVTGTLLDGSLRLGQELEVQPGGLKTRVRGLQSHKRKLEDVGAGTRVAVNLGGVAVDDLRRGQVLSSPGALRPTAALDARLRLVPGAPAMRHRAAVTFHTGAAESPARVLLLDRDELQPGEEAWVQVKLQDEVAIARGDLFIVRLPSPSMTVGGGTVAEPHARRHRRNQASVLDRLAVLAQGSPEEVILQQLAARDPADLDDLTRRSGLAPADVRAAVEHLVSDGSAVVVGGGRLDAKALVMSEEGWTALGERAERLLAEHHRAYPLRRGLPKEELRTRLGAESRLFARALERWKAEGRFAEDGPFVRLAVHQVRLSPEQEQAAAHVVALLREGGVAAPDRAEWESLLRISPELTEALVARGDLVEVAPGLVYDRGTLEGLISTIRHGMESGPMTVAQIRDLLGASRKFVLALVSYTDEHKITRRVGDERILY